MKKTSQQALLDSLALQIAQLRAIPRWETPLPPPAFQQLVRKELFLAAKRARSVLHEHEHQEEDQDDHL